MITQAMILAAGRGRRMQPLTLHTPKPLLTVAGKPLIVWHIEMLRQAGVQRIVVNVGYLADKMMAFFAQHDFGLPIVLSVENEPFLETAGGIKKALSQGLLDDTPFVLVNGDVWCDLNRKQLCQHRLGGALGHLYLVDNPDYHAKGDFCLSQDGYVMDSGAGLQSLTFAGLSVLSPKLVAQVVAGQSAALAPFLYQAAQESQLTGEQLPSCVQWVDVGTPERLQALDNRLHQSLGGSD